eukprot:7387478-Prymnesium_polylepis.1
MRPAASGALPWRRRARVGASGCAFSASCAADRAPIAPLPRLPRWPGGDAAPERTPARRSFRRTWPCAVPRRRRLVRQLPRRCSWALKWVGWP